MKAWRRYLRFWGSDIDGDVDDELQFHLERRIDDYMRRGLSRADAERAARDRFGDVEGVEQQLKRHDRTRARRDDWRDVVERTWQNIRFALRSFRRTPTFFIAAVAILALGIGATSAVFSIATSVLIRDLPIRDQDRVIALWATGTGAASEVPTTLDRYERFRRTTRTLSAVAGFAHYGSNMSPLQDETTALHARESLVTGSFFDVLGARAVIGRLLRPDDEVMGAVPVMVISEAFWRSAFGADRRVIGRRLRILNREITATVVGVAPAGLEYPSGTDYWIPIAPTKYSAVDLVARLLPIATARSAREEFLAFIENDTRAHPNDAGARSLLAIGAEVRPLPELIIGPVRQPIIILSVAVGGLLLIACVNVGNLLLVRATSRAHELAIRRALGASSLQILTQLLTEVSLLAIAGTVLGCAVAFTLLRMLVAAAPAGLPRLDEIALSPIAVGVATILTALSLCIAGVIPAFVFGQGIASTLRVDGRAGVETSGRRTLRSVMVASQIALALVLLAFAGLLTRSLLRLEGINLGYVPAHLSIVQVSVPFRKYGTRQRLDDAFDELQRQFHAVPGVSAVTPVLALPFLGSNVFAARIEARGHSEFNGAAAPYVSWDAVGPEFSRAMDAPIIRGRGISDQDRDGAPRVAVITQDLANRYWPGEDAIGKQIRFAGISGEDTTWRTVVGIIRPLNYRTLRESTPTVLFSYRQEFQQGLFAVRSSRDLPTILPALRRAAHASDPDILLWRAQTMDQILAGPLGRPRLEAFLLTAFAAVALLLAAVGLYGVTTYVIRQQTRDIGIRIALGATTGRVLRMVLGNALKVALIGVVAGAGLSFFSTRFVSAQLFEISSADPIALAGAAALLMIVIFIASYIPARRAARVDPIRALRAE